MKLALAGDTTLGRGVARALESGPVSALFAPEVVEAAHEADLFVLNLECCISDRGGPWSDPFKPFFFRAPPDLRNDLGLLWLVTLAENRPVRVEALPLELDYCHTRPAEGEDAAWISRRFREACARLGTDMQEQDGRLVVTW